MPTITKRLLDAIEPDGRLRIIRDDELTGFGVQVTPAGQISFCVTYTTQNKSRRRVIGRFGPMSVDQARKAALAHLAIAAKGDDPLPDHDRHFPTIAALYEAWMARHVAVHLKAKSAQSYRKSFEAHCRKSFGHIAPSELDYATLAEAHAGMAGTPFSANHMLRTMRAMLTWAIDSRLLTCPDGNPAVGHRFYDEVPSDRILSVPEIRTFIVDLPRAAMDRSTRHALMLGLLLGQRPDEIATMRVAAIDLTAATWTLAAEDNKGKRLHVVPLPPWAREIITAALEDAKGAFLFPSPVGDPKAPDAAPIEAHALSTALRRAQRPVKPSKDAPKASTRKPSWVFDFKDRAGNPNPISPHDLRRTCSSYLELLGFGDFVRGAILNHSKQTVTGKHYSAGELLKLKRTALLQWEAALRQIVAGHDPFASHIEDDRAEEERVLGRIAQ